MGLDNFSTEGPRTYKSDSSRSIGSAKNVFHVLAGMNPQSYDFISDKRTHKVFLVDASLKITLPTNDAQYTCPECGKVSETYESMIKTDFLPHKDRSGSMQCLKNLIEGAANQDESSYVYEKYDGKLKSTDSNNSTESDTSSNNDDDFNSGLGNFTT